MDFYALRKPQSSNRELLPMIAALPKHVGFENIDENDMGFSMELMALNQEHEQLCLVDSSRFYKSLLNRVDPFTVVSMALQN